MNACSSITRAERGTPLRHRLYFALFVALGALAAGDAVHAQQPGAEPATQDYRITAGSLGDALNQVATQSKLQIVYSPELVRGRTVPAVGGPQTWREALQKLLAGSGLEWGFVNDTTVVIKRGPAAPNAPSADAGPVGSGQVVRRSSSAASPEIAEMDRIVVRRPFTDANVDIVRTENDAQPYYIFAGEEIARANTINVEDFLKQRLTMNSVAGTYSQSTALGVRGNASQVNLRGFGENQTLILVNGRRVAGATGSSALRQFDLNAFAPDMIERIEVLPSSASAIYGGSAVGGVLNVILKRDFVGGDVRFTYDTPLDEHAPIRTATAAYGWSLEDGRTNITLSVSYRDSESLLYKDRPELVQRGISRILETSPSLLYGAASPFAFGATPNITSQNGAELVFKDGTPLGGTGLGSSLTYIPVGTSPATSLAQLQADLLANAGRQNTSLADSTSGSLGGLLRPFGWSGEAKSATGAIRRQMTERLELVAELFYNNNESVNWDSHAQRIRIPAASPANPFNQDVLVAFPVPMSQAFPVRTSAESIRGVLGFVVDLPRDWRAQGDYTWNQNEGWYHSMRFDYATGQVASAAAYRDGTLNPFVDTMAYPMDLAPFSTPLDYMSNKRVSTLADSGLRVSGPIGRLPAGAPNLTIGIGHRKEGLDEGYEDYSGVGKYTFFPQSQRVSSVYAEALVPLVGPANAVPGVRLLDLQIASRLEDFSVDTGTSYRFTFPPDHAVDPNETLVREKVDYSATNTTVGLRYKPVDSLTLRASYATAFLPPGFSDLLAGTPSLVNTAGLDPKRGDELFSVPFISGGNPDLKPLESETWNAGIVFEPTFWKGVRLGLEWFRIKRSNLIFSPNLVQLMENEDLFPGRVTRADPAPGDPFQVGPVTLVDLSLLSTDHVSTKGFDVSMDYRMATERHGLFTFGLLGTVVDTFTRQLTLVSPEEDIVGQVSNNGPLKLRANAALGWEWGNWTLAWTALYYSSYEQNTNPLFIQAQGGTTVPSQIYHNVLAGYRFPSAEGASGASWALSDLTITLGVRNVFDRVPPFDASQSNVQRYSPFGDYRLRSVQLSIGKKF